MHFSMFETLYGSLGQDRRIERHFTSSWQGGIKAPMDSLCRMLGASAADFVPYDKAKWQKWDLYVSSCFDNPWFARNVPWADTFHGVGEKWVEDGSRLYMCHPLGARYDRLLCPNSRLARQFWDHPAFMKTPESVRLTGLAKGDLLAWLNDGEVRAALQKALPPGAQAPVILFAPTWGADGLLARHGEEVVRACRRAGFRVIVKLHACSHLPGAQFNGGVDWSRRMEEWTREHGILHMPASPLSALMLAADAMISDFGSAPVEFCLTDRPLVFFSIEAQAARIGGDRFQFDALLSAASTVCGPDGLEGALRAALAGKGGAGAARRAVREAFFHEPGRATASSLRELYGLMDLEGADAFVEQFRTSLRASVLENPARFLGVGLS